MCLLSTAAHTPGRGPNKPRRTEVLPKRTRNPASASPFVRAKYDVVPQMGQLGRKPLLSSRPPASPAGDHNERLRPQSYRQHGAPVPTDVNSNVQIDRHVVRNRPETVDQECG